jgi:hypothetical protein
MSEDVRETIQTIFIVAGVIAVVFLLSDCANKMDTRSDEIRMKKVESIGKVNAKCRVYFDK